MKAVILAAGEGRRLRPFTETKPKVMLPVANKPILGYVVDAAAKNGIDEIILVVGYRKEAIMDYFKDYNEVPITYIIQDKQLGTAHALYQTKDHIDDSFLVLPGDNLIDGRDVAQLIQKKATYAVMIKEHNQPSKYGMVSIKEGLLDQFIEKSKEEHSHLISTGIYKFPPTVFKEIKQLISQGDYTLSSVIQSLIEQKQEIQTIQAELWRDVIYPWDLLDINDVMLKTIPSSIHGTVEKSVTIKGPVYIGEQTQIHAGTYIIGPVVIGKHCEIGPNVCIFPSTTIGDNTIVKPFSEIRNSVLMNDIQIGSNTFISHSIIGTGSILHHGASTIVGPTKRYHGHEMISIKDIGAMIAEDTTIQSHVITHPGIIIGRHCDIHPMKQIREDIASETKVM